MGRLRSWSLLSIIISLVGIAVAGYLSFASFNLDMLTCNIGDCLTVQSSDYARIAGIPIALLGLGMFAAIFSLGVARIMWSGFEEFATFAAFALAVTGTLYSAYLTYVEIWVIEAICQWCVASAVLTVGLAISETVGVTRLLRE
jgi:uncharacterized membrane protein